MGEIESATVGCRKMDNPVPSCQIAPLVLNVLFGGSEICLNDPKLPTQHQKNGHRLCFQSLHNTLSVDR